MSRAPRGGRLGVKENVRESAQARGEAKDEFEQGNGKGSFFDISVLYANY